MGQLLNSLNSQIDDSVPLVFEGGWVHLECGGPAEKSTHYNVAYCQVCGYMVSSKTVGKAIGNVYNMGDRGTGRA